MALQKAFKKSYIEYLKTHIDVDAYLQDEFEYDSSQVVKLYGIEEPDGLLEKMVPRPTGDIESAIAIYEAYKNISPLVAQRDDLWVYLSHTTLFPYLKQRWEIDSANESAKNFIAEHWFQSQHGAIRSAIMGLWWSAYLSVDENREDPYELTRILFSNYSLRNVYFGATQLFRYKEATIGILSFLHDNPEIMEEHFENRVRFISRYFNQLGGTKQLAALDFQFFYHECLKIRSQILAATQRDDVQNIDILKISENTD